MYIKRNRTCSTCTFPQWGRTANNWDISTGPLARPFARSLAPLSHSLPSSWESELLMSQNDLILPHSASSQTRKSGNHSTAKSSRAHFYQIEMSILRHFRNTFHRRPTQIRVWKELIPSNFCPPTDIFF